MYRDQADGGSGVPPVGPGVHLAGAVPFQVGPDFLFMVRGSLLVGVLDQVDFLDGGQVAGHAFDGHPLSGELLQEGRTGYLQNVRCPDELNVPDQAIFALPDVVYNGKEP